MASGGFLGVWNIMAARFSRAAESGRQGFAFPWYRLSILAGGTWLVMIIMIFMIGQAFGLIQANGFTFLKATLISGVSTVFSVISLFALCQSARIARLLYDPRPFGLLITLPSFLAGAVGGLVGIALSIMVPALGTLRPYTFPELLYMIVAGGLFMAALGGGTRALELKAMQAEEAARAKAALEEELRARVQEMESLTSYSTLLESIGDAVAMTDLNGTITLLNEAGARLHGYGREALMGKNAFDLIAEESQAKARQGMAEVLLKGKITGYELFILDRQGKKIPVEMSVTLVRDAQGRPQGFIAVSRDINQRKQAQEQESLRQLGASVEARTKVEQTLLYLNAVAAAAKRTLNPEGMLASTTEELTKLKLVPTIYLLDESRENLVAKYTGMDPKLLRQVERLIGRKLTEVKVPLARVPTLKEVIERGKTATTQELSELVGQFLPTPHLKNYARTLIEGFGLKRSALAPLSVKGEVIGVLSLSWEGTRCDEATAEALANQLAIALENAHLYQESQSYAKQMQEAYEKLKATQEQLVQAEKLRGLGEMAAGMAHDINNSLAALLISAQLLADQVASPNAQKTIEAIKQATLDCAETVRRVQEFAGVRTVREGFVKVDVNQIVKDVVAVTKPRWKDEAQASGRRIRVVTYLGLVPPVAGNPSELREVLTNLVVNAIDAMPQGGTITLHTMTKKDQVLISVTDTGIGMSEEVKRRIFDPFFTTKGPKGTGLGLSVAFGIVKRHGGEISVLSTEGSGSTLTVRLPMATDTVEAGEEREATPPPKAGPADILVVEDDEMILEALSETIRRAGYYVTSASSGEEGLAFFKKRAYDLVLTDLSMPGMSGWEVAQAIKERDSKVPVILLTGWGDQLDQARMKQSGADRVLAKPCDKDEILRLVSEALTHRKP